MLRFRSVTHLSVLAALGFFCLGALVALEREAHAYNSAAAKDLEIGAVNPVPLLATGNPTVLTMAAASQSVIIGQGKALDWICTADSYYVTGTGSATASTASFYVPANTTRHGGLLGFADTFAVYSASGSCYIVPVGR